MKKEDFIKNQYIAAYSLAEGATHAKRCTDAKRLRGIVGLIKECFGGVCQNRHVTLNLIQGLSMPMKNILAKEKPLTRICKLTSFVNKFHPLPQGAREDGSVPSIREREHASCAERTVTNLLPYSPISLLPSKKVAFTLAEGATHVALSESQRKVAFTLAEVLITLGIIGVVAALTLPSVINKYRSQVLHKQFLKSYSNLQQVILLMKNDLGIENLRAEYATYVSGKGYPYANAFYAEFDKYMKVVKQVPQYSIKNYSGTAEAGKYGYGMDNPQPLYVLPDGSSVGRVVNSSTVYLFIDVNGPKKAPNRYGFDVFRFDLSNKDMVVPLKQIRLYTEEELEDMRWPGLAGYPCSVKSNQQLNGTGCSWYAVDNINPDDETKKYWDSLPW